MTEETLPPLPGDPGFPTDPHVLQLMHAYGRACADAAIERCAAVCDPSNKDNPSDWTNYAKTRAECATAIRALKGTTT